ncbi:MAG TPA: DUF3891 family protein [Bacillales bacterium]|nr:DUF3891 family protein [Bacillales bacterium]
MIVREDGVFFGLIRQHDHGLLSGEIAARWGNEHFSSPGHSMIIAASLHDLSWIEADEQILWDEAAERPHDFVSLPNEHRLPMYEKGLQLTEQLNPFGGLLVSKHYCSFLNDNENAETDRFLQNERNRQQRLTERFSESALDRDLLQLQCWDNLSLYVCMHRPGCSKDEEIDWFKNGIRCPKKSGEDVWINVKWLNERTISLDPFPFQESWSTTVPYTRMRKSLGRNDPDLRNIMHRRIRFSPNDAGGGC